MRISDWSSDVCSSDLLFYYYFESKEEVYKLVLEDAAEHAISLLLEQDYQDMSAESAIRMFFSHIFNQYMEMPFLIKFQTDQDYNCGAHISARKKLRSLLPDIIERVAVFLTRGEPQGERSTV